MQRDSGAPLYEFFCGGGLARLGLEPDFDCVFANDIDPHKAKAYGAAFGRETLRAGDIWALEPADLPGHAALAWASFPCQDLSLAGARGGLSAARSGAFWGFYRLIEALVREDRAPAVLALENVIGLLSSHGGEDFTGLVTALDALGYRVGALEIDAALFVPQSRQRLFIVATRMAAPPHLKARRPSEPFHSEALQDLVTRLPEHVRAAWIWWQLDAPPRRNTRLIDLLDETPEDAWDAPEKTARILALMNPLHRERVASIQKAGRVEVGAVFKRIRIENGQRVQRAEARFDGLAGCLRTPAGGSSRQILLFIEGDSVRSRLISSREAARLMGAPDHYPLPKSQNAALHLFGDGVCVSAVRWLSEHLLAPLVSADSHQERTAL